MFFDQFFKINDLSEIRDYAQFVTGLVNQNYDVYKSDDLHGFMVYIDFYRDKLSADVLLQLKHHVQCIYSYYAAKMLPAVKKFYPAVVMKSNGVDEFILNVHLIYSAVYHKYWEFSVCREKWYLAYLVYSDAYKTVSKFLDSVSFPVVKSYYLSMFAEDLTYYDYVDGFQSYVIDLKYGLVDLVYYKPLTTRSFMRDSYKMFHVYDAMDIIKFNTMPRVINYAIHDDDDRYNPAVRKQKKKLKIVKEGKKPESTVSAASDLSTTPSVLAQPLSVVSDTSVIVPLPLSSPVLSPAIIAAARNFRPTDTIPDHLNGLVTDNKGFSYASGDESFKKNDTEYSFDTAEIFDTEEFSTCHSNYHSGLSSLQSIHSNATSGFGNSVVASSSAVALPEFTSQSMPIFNDVGVVATATPSVKIAEVSAPLKASAFDVKAVSETVAVVPAIPSVPVQSLSTVKTADSISVSIADLAAVPVVDSEIFRDIKRLSYTGTDDTAACERKSDSGKLSSMGNYIRYLNEDDLPDVASQLMVTLYNDGLIRHLSSYDHNSLCDTFAIGCYKVYDILGFPMKRGTPLDAHLDCSCCFNPAIGNSDCKRAYGIMYGITLVVIPSKAEINKLQKTYMKTCVTMVSLINAYGASFGGDYRSLLSVYHEYCVQNSIHVFVLIDGFYGFNNIDFNVINIFIKDGSWKYARSNLHNFCDAIRAFAPTVVYSSHRMKVLMANRVNFRVATPDTINSMTYMTKKYQWYNVITES